MATQDDIREQIDRSFGEGPGRGPRDDLVDDLVGRGHRALARRRLAAVVAGAAVVAVVGGTSFVAWGGTDVGPRAGAGFASDRTAAATASPATSAGASATSTTPPSRAEISRALGRGLARYDHRGDLVVGAGATVLRRIDDPYAATGAGRSVALVLELDGAMYWCALYQASSGDSGGAYAWSGDHADETFDAWVQEQRSVAESALGSAPSGSWPGTPNNDLVRFGAGERLQALAGVRILEQRPHVAVGASFAGPGDRTAAAEVVAADGTRYYVLARRLAGGGPAQYIRVAAANGGATLDDFLHLARARYAEGGGGLL